VLPCIKIDTTYSTKIKGNKINSLNLFFFMPNAVNPPFKNDIKIKKCRSMILVRENNDEKRKCVIREAI